MNDYDIHSTESKLIDSRKVGMYAYRRKIFFLKYFFGHREGLQAENADKMSYTCSE